MTEEEKPNKVVALIVTFVVLGLVTALIVYSIQLWAL